MVDGTDDRAQHGATQEEASADGHADATTRPAAARKPVSFDFKLRLTSPDDGPPSAPQEVGIELEPLDLAAITGVQPDTPRAYQTDGDLQSLIVELANQIADPNTASTPVVRVTASATIEKSRSSSRAAEAAPAGHRGESPSEPVTVPAARAASPVMPSLAGLVPKLAPLTSSSPSSPPAPTPSLGTAGPIAPSLPRLAPVPPVEEPAPDVDVPALADAELERDTATDPARVPGPEEAVEAVEAAEAVEPSDEAAAVEELAVAAPVADAPADDTPAAEAPVVEVPVVEAPVVAAPVVAAPVAAAPVVAPVPPAAAAPAVPAMPAAVVSETPVVAAPAPAAPTLVSNAAAMAAAAAPAPASVPPLNLAKIERRPNAERPTKPVDFHALLGQAGLQPPAKRRKKRHPFRFLFKLIVLLGIVGAGLYFGKIYVLDKRWDPELKPYADDVSTERQLEWKKALKIEALPADDYAAKLVAVGLPTADGRTMVEEWRAMGLAEGDIDLDTVGAAAMSSVPVFYDPAEGVLYELDGVDDELREWALDQALTAALLDQHFHWSDDLAEAAPGVRTGVRAIVSGDALATTTAVVRPRDDDQAALAEQIADLAADAADDALGAPAYATHLLQPQGPLPPTFSDDMADRDDLYTTPIESDAAVFDPMRGLDASSDPAAVPAETRGMMYWYYALAGRLSPAEAWDAALTWQSDEVQVDGASANGTCVTATVTTVDEAGRALLLDAMTRWAAAAPPQAGTTIEPVGTDQIRVFACDPGPEADAVTNPTVPAFGESVGEYAVLEATEASTAALRSCVINAVRGFDVVGVQQRGDVTAYDGLVASIDVACHGTPAAPAAPVAPAADTPASVPAVSP